MPITTPPATRSLRPFQAVTTRTTPTRIRVTVSGEVDMATAPQLHDVCLSALTNNHPSALNVDLTDVSFLDCAGLTALIRVRSAARELDCVMWVSHPQPHIDRVLSVTGMLRVLAAPTPQPVFAAA